MKPGHRNLAYPLHGLANVYRESSRHAEAETFYRRALDLREKTLDPDHPEVQDTVADYAVLLRSLGRHGEAADLESRAGLAAGAPGD